MYINCSWDWIVRDEYKTLHGIGLSAMYTCIYVKCTLHVYKLFLGSGRQRCILTVFAIE